MPEPLFPIFEDSPYTKLTGIEFTRRGEGYSQTVLKITEPVLGLTNGSVHGGAVATLVDVGMAAALLTRIKDDEMAATIQLQLNYLASARTGVLVCDSKIIRKGNKIAIAESEIKNEDTLVAKATATFKIYKTKAA